MMVVAIFVGVGGCESRHEGIVDPFGVPPFLKRVNLTPAQVNSDTINTGSTRQPEDLLTIAATIVADFDASLPRPASVAYRITSIDSLSIISAGELRDDGNAPDQSKGDNSFTVRATLQIRRVQIGTFIVEVSGVSAEGYKSNTTLSPLNVYRGNHPPVVSDLVAPDTIKLGNETQLLLVSIRAADADGLADISKVIFNSFRPDNSASGGNPFVMYDDGLSSHGDVKAGDGIHSLLISLPASTQVGTYRFEFQAYDRSNQPSNVVVLRLTVRA
jgi:hypothetical protein